MTAKSISMSYLVITHLVSLLILGLYLLEVLLGNLIANAMSFDSGLHASAIIMNILLVVVPSSAIILPAVFSWKLWKRGNLKWANGLTIINWGIIIIVVLLCSG